MKVSNIALITDFGHRDEYTGTMKGVIKSINPSADIIDISHEILAQNIIQGAYILSASHMYFPEGTIFVCIVDPGVGTERKAIISKHKNRYYIAPDNGLLSLSVDYEKSFFYIINNPDYMLPTPCHTFHGRDIFAPVSAYLSIGILPEEIGTKTEPSSIIKLDIPAAISETGDVFGIVLNNDKFGNVITSLKKEALSGNLIKSILINDMEIPFRNTFSIVEPGKWLSYIGSSGYVEIAVNRGEAAKEMELNPGDNIEFKLI